VLFLLFKLDAERYALEGAQIVEILPLLQITRIPRAPAGVRGVFSYRRTPVPAIDLSELILGRPAEHRLTTRIVLIRDTSTVGARPQFARAGIPPRLFGLITEGATETVQFDPSQFNRCDVGGRNAPYLGPIVHTGRGFIQQILTDKLLTDAVRDTLFAPLTTV
jgi:chemotaxis-related protein WspB